MNTSAAKQFRSVAALAVLFCLFSLVVDGRAKTNEAPIVITAENAPIESFPSGEQSLSLAAESGGPATLDPAFVWDIGSTFVARQVFRGLTRLDDQLNPVPELADRIEISPDGLSYQFHIRESAKFQDGSPIDAEDVVFSLTRALHPATAGGDPSQLVGPTFLSDIDGASDLFAGSVDHLSGVTSLDEQTVEIRLSSPRSTFLMKLAAIPASILDSEQIERDDLWWRSPNGSGPFTVAEWIDGERLRLEPSRHYYAGVPSLESIEIRLGQSAVQPFNMYQAGEIDIATVDLSSIDRVLSSKVDMNDELIVTPQFALEYVAFRTDVEPMDDPHIRKAVQLGFERAKIASVTFDGHVSPACGIVPNGMLGVDWPCEGYDFDPQRANAEIAQSRYGSADNVPPIEVYIGVSNAGRTMADTLREALEESTGLEVRVIAVELSEFLAGLGTRAYPAYAVYWSADYPDPESLLWTLFSSESKDNYTDYRNDAFDQELRRAANEQDPNRRIEIYSAAQQMLIDDAVVIPLYYDVSYTVAKPHVRGLVVTPIGILGLERLWLEH